MAVDKPFDVYALGNALVDILAFVEDDFVKKVGFPKGSMNLVDTEKRTEILEGLNAKDLKMASGGSAANSLIALLQSGGTGVFAGKVAQDDQGEFYGEDMKKAGAVFDIPAGDPSVDPTGTSIILTTPDAERTMCTHLGISVQLEPEDVATEQVGKCKICYIEGYMWSGPSTKAAAMRLMEVAKSTDTLVSFTFSDSFLVNAFAEEFKKDVLPNCDIVFCNSDEAKSFTGCDDTADAALEIGKMVNTVFVTDGKKGAVVVAEGKVEHVSGYQAKAIDSVGAGDAFAGGVLYALAHGHDPKLSAKWGNRLASKIVEVQGPRLDEIPSDLKASILGNS